MALLEIKGLTKKYGHFLALDKVDLSVEEGKIVGLLGPNGSGKTTMLKCIAGLLTKSEGEILIDGNEVGVKTKAVVSFLPERTYLEPNMTVKSVFDMFSDFYADFDEGKAYNMLSTLNVDKNAKLKTLSKGTKEKVQLIAVMARRARLYLLDEPIGGVDPAAREFIIDTVLKNVDKTSTIIISTHLIRDIEDVLDDYIFIHENKILSHGSAKDVHDNGKTVDETFREVFRCRQ